MKTAIVAGKRMALSLFVFLSLFCACMQINTKNPDKAFRYWTQVPLSNTEVEVLKGKYWKSAHFTLEYEVFLKIKASQEWKNELIKLNSLKIDSAKWSKPQNIPDWFIPSQDYIQYKSSTNQSFIYYEQVKGDTIYIYDIQL
jgi:hypothetical protein